MIILYVYGCISMLRTEKEANAIFTEIDGKVYKMTDEGTMEEYMGILITHNKYGTYMISQPHLIDRTINLVPSMKYARSANTPTAAGKILTKDLEGEKKKEHWNYRSIIGILKYLVNCTHPEISFAVHQCASLCIDPKYSHEQTLKRIIR